MGRKATVGAAMGLALVLATGCRSDGGTDQAPVPDPDADEAVEPLVEPSEDDNTLDIADLCLLLDGQPDEVRERLIEDAADATSASSTELQERADATCPPDGD